MPKLDPHYNFYLYNNAWMSASNYSENFNPLSDRDLVPY